MQKYDFHIHSRYSKDSKTPLKDILHAAQNKGLNGIAICDHDEVKGGLKAMEIVRRRPEKYGDLHVIPGTEVSTAKGHMLVLGVSEKIPMFMTPEETADYARDLNALSIIAHPYRKAAHGIGYIEGIGADAVETFNSKCLTNGANNKARKEAQRLNMPQVGGSDAHFAELVGQGYTLIDVQENTQESIFKAIRSGKTIPRGEKTPKKIVVGQIKTNIIRRTQLFFKRNEMEADDEKQQ
jgi:predicted metal-dependent phosphoesterase TrpH